MTNAMIVGTTFGYSQNSLPFVILNFNCKNKDDDDITIATKPIFLINPQKETLDNSAAAATILSILSTVGASYWEELTGKIVRIEINDNNEITSITHAIDSRYIQLINNEDDQLNSNEDTRPSRKSNPFIKKEVTDRAAAQKNID